MGTYAIADALKDVLADTYALYLKTQNYHWNVIGPRFKSLHEQFEAEYINLRDAIDEIAERIRVIGAKAPGGFNAYSKLTRIQDGDENADADTMTRQLRDDQLTIVGTLKKAVEVAEKYGDDATADQMIARIYYHQQQAWMLSAMLGEEVPQSAGITKAA